MLSKKKKSNWKTRRNLVCESAAEEAVQAVVWCSCGCVCAEGGWVCGFVKRGKILLVFFGRGRGGEGERERAREGERGRGEEGGS